MNYKLTWLTAKQVEERGIPANSRYKWVEGTFEDGVQIRVPYRPRLRQDMGEAFAKAVDDLMREGYHDYQMEELA